MGGLLLIEGNLVAERYHDNAVVIVFANNILLHDISKAEVVTSLDHPTILGLESNAKGNREVRGCQMNCVILRQ